MVHCLDAAGNARSQLWILVRTFALLLLAAAATLALAPAPPADLALFSTEARARIAHRTADGRAVKGRHLAAPGIDFIARTRLYGSPTLNIDDARLRAWLALRPSLAKTTAAGWSFVGPTNIAGRIRALAFHPVEPATLYAGSASGGLFYSTDGGTSWQPRGDGMPAMPIGALAVHPGHPDDLWIGTGEPTIPLSRAASAPVFGGVGILHSTDRGLTWTRLAWGSQSTAINRIVLHDASRDTILAATRDGVRRTTDAGATWVNALPGVISDLARKPSSDATVYAAVGNELGGGANGVYRSDAGGARFTWRKLAVNFPTGDSTGRIVLAVSAADPDLLLALVASPFYIGASFRNDVAVLMRSTDGGESWQRHPEAIPTNAALGQAHYNLCLAVSPDDAALVYAGGIEVWKSQNGGRNFAAQTFAGQVVHVDQHTFAFRSDGVLHVGNDGGVFRTTNAGQTWMGLNDGLATSQFYTIAVDRQNPARLYGGTQDNGTVRFTGAGGTAWTIVRGDVDGGFVAADGNLVYTLATLIRYPLRSTDGGQLWTEIVQGLGTRMSDNWLQPLRLHPSDRTRLYTATNRVFVAENVHDPIATPEWRPLSDVLADGTTQESVISTIAIAPGDSTRMYVGTGTGAVYVTRSLLSATPTWTRASSGIPARWITRIAVSPFNADVAYLTVSGFGSGHVFVTRDGGASWIDISGDLPDVPVNAIAASRQRTGVLYIATDLGVWTTMNDGGSWTRLGADFPNVVVYDLALTPTHRLIAATHGRGVWSVDVTLDARAPVAALPFSVQAVHALGAGARAAIDIRTDASDVFDITLVDMTGRVRATERKQLAAGTHRCQLGDGVLPTGVWIVHVRSHAGARSTRLLTLR